MTDLSPLEQDRTGTYLGWTLLVALAFAVSIAISLAVQLDDARTSPPRSEPPPCGGLYEPCCEDWDDNWGPCITECDDDHPDDRERPEGPRGLFDAEENFAEGRLPSRC